MATKIVNMAMTRGDSALLSGTITPKTGTLSLPITELRMQLRLRANHTSFIVEKTVGDGVTIISSDPEEIEYTIALDPEDTVGIVENEVYYDVELTESDGFVSTPVGGRIELKPDVTR